MKIDVRLHGFTAGEGLRNYVGLRLMSALDHLVRQVDVVTVCVGDAPSSEGAIDRRCRMLARLGSAEDVRVEETASDLYSTIDRAALRLADAVAAAQLSRGRKAAPGGRARRAAEAVRVG